MPTSPQNNQPAEDAGDRLKAFHLKDIQRGILQIAVAFYHLGNLNWRGGAILRGEGINRLGRFEPSYEGVDVESLIDQSIEWLEWVQTAGEEGLSALMANEQRVPPTIKQV